jgi:UDP-N-acetyl-D-glucosamine dehydrogenase
MRRKFMAFELTTLAPAPAEQLRSRIELRTARVAIVGLGHVGLPLAETFAEQGYSVIGFDIDLEKIKRLRLKQSYVGHMVNERIARLIDSEHFEPSADPQCFEEADAIILCVPTPLTPEREPDLSQVVAAGQTLSRYLRRGQLVVLESTTYPGTTDELLLPILEQSGLRAGRDFFLAFSPEREDPHDYLHSTGSVRKVVGGIDPLSGDLAVELYRPLVSGVVPTSSSRVAEACNILENVYSAVNIALVNELKVVFNAMGIDVWEVIAAAKTKPFGFEAFYPGPGLGGHCIDPFYLTWVARRFGIAARFIELAGEVNTAMPLYVVNRVAEALNDDNKPVKGSRVCVLGVAYKKDVDDPRESPAFPILEMLQKRGALVSYSDPHVPVLPKMRYHSIQLESEELSDEFIGSQDCLVIVTDHARFEYARLVEQARLIVDTRNATAGLEATSCRIVKA